MKKILFMGLSLLTLACTSGDPSDSDPTKDPLISDTIKDIDGNIYTSVVIGKQEWMKENLNVSKYRNGDIIPEVTDPTEWANLTTGAWCYYENKTENGVVYGKLYNWYAVNDPRGLAPEGWHVPKDIEWTTLTTQLEGSDFAGGSMKESGNSHWESPNTDATNSSGFTGLPAGTRNPDGYFQGDLGQNTDWWASTHGESTTAWTRGAWYKNGWAFLSPYDFHYGYSVRCVRDYSDSNPNNDPLNSDAIKDIDGNTYNAVVIGKQVWMKENLNVSKYRNGDLIPEVTDPTEWANLTTGAWCYYENKTENGPVYGKLYNWYAVNDPRGLAPEGWHVPKDIEWTALTTQLEGGDFAGGSMKESGNSHWESPNTDATNSSGFTGLPAGTRSPDGFFQDDLGQNTDWWASTHGDSTTAWSRGAWYKNGWAFLSPYDFHFGFSVRCVKD